MISSRKDACARALFFVSSPTASGVQLAFETNSIWIFSTSILSFFTLLSRTRDRRLGSEIPLSTLVASDRLTSFCSVRKRGTKALRKQPMGGIESSASKRTSWNPGRPPFSSSLDRALPSLHCITVHCLASSQRCSTSPRKGTTSFPLTKTEPAVQGSPHNACIRLVFASSFVSAVYKGMAMVRPMLEYASVVWEPTKNSTLVALERSQLSIARAITRLSRRRHSNEAVLAKIGWPTLAWRRRRYKLSLVWRLLNGEGPPSLSSFFSLPLSSRSHYSLRNPHSLPQVLCHTSHRLKDFLPSAIALWNRLPSCICFCKSSRSFLAELDNHFSVDKFSFGLP